MPDETAEIRDDEESIASLLDFSEEKLAPWQQHALKLLVTRGAISDQEEERILALCLSEHGFRPETPPGEADKLSAADVERTAAEARPVVIRRIDGVENVNALDSSSELVFEEEGDPNPSMVLVYGDNASGKSGFARILRATCHSRSRDKNVLPNAVGNPAAPQSATIHFRAGEEPDSLTWEPEGSSTSDLRTVNYFDSDCAERHVGSENHFEYAPYEIDMLKSLAALYQRIRKRLGTMVEVIEGKRPLRELPPDLHQEVRRQLEQVTAETDVEALTSWARLSTQERTRLERLRRDLATTPEDRARQLQAYQNQISELRNALEQLSALISDEAMVELRSIVQRAVSTREAARMAASRDFAEEPLGGVGSKAWRHLWEAARAYSEEYAYPGEAFPYLGETARCVLCQQPLGSAGIRAVRKFEEFVQDRTQRLADEAAVALEERIASIRELDLDGEPFKSGLRGLRTLPQPAVAGAVRRVLRSTRKRLRAMLRAASTGEWPELPGIDGGNINRDLGQLNGKLQSEVDAVRKLASSRGRQTLEAELDSLLAKEALRKYIGVVRRERDLLKKRRILGECIGACDTNAITRETTRISSILLSDAFRERFETELRELNFSTVAMTIENPGSEYGAPRFRVALEQAPSAEPKRILSEGEHRCVAIAAFLAELDSRENRSAVVFDDPVTSLDHRWRERVATRLVREATKRQVIVFTHDIVFLSQLMRQADDQGVLLVPRHLERLGRVIGRSKKGMPWIAMKVSERIGHLRDELVKARRAHRDGDRDGYSQIVESLYKRMRESWERAVEEILVNDAIKRFNRDIETRRLRNLAAVTDDDVDAISAGVARCSEFVHDAAEADNPPLPEPNEIQADLDRLVSWVEAARPRLAR